MYPRILNLPDLLKKKSHFLFGARASGKTTLVDYSLADALVIDLLNSRTFSNLLKNPNLIEELIVDPTQIVVIDEVQKLPVILDEVQRLIQKKGITFLLTGSSARKLKHGGGNLLAGRAREARLFPLVSKEIATFDLLKFLNHGGLPEIYDSDEPDEDLAAYVDTYLREEIKAEAVTRNVSAFAEFLDACALSNGQEVNYESFAADLQVSPGTLKNYFQILEDTLIGFSLPGYTKTKKRKAISRSKHYLFDLGVCRYLAKIDKIQLGSKAFGDFFEHFIILELRAYLSYSRKKLEMKYWRSTSQFEVDLIIGDKIAIEIKSTENPSDKHLKGLRAFREEGICEKYYLVSNCGEERITADKIHILPWKLFLQKVWNDEIL
jgi:uncharacterized protein